MGRKMEPVSTDTVQVYGPSVMRSLVVYSTPYSTCGATQVLTPSPGSWARVRPVLAMPRQACRRLKSTDTYGYTWHTTAHEQPALATAAKGGRLCLSPSFQAPRQSQHGAHGPGVVQARAA